MLVQLVAVASLCFQDPAAPAPAAQPAAPTSIAGIYQGTLEAGAVKLRLALHLEQGEQGYAAKLDSLDQGAMGLPATKVEVAERRVTASWATLGATIDGVVSNDFKTLDSRFEQGSLKTTLTMHRVDKVRQPLRPQEPKPPFPYRTEDVTFDSANPDVELAGTLSAPEGAGPYAAVVLVSGSGPQNRDEELLGHKPFLVLADYLTRRGILVLRYDDRGTGQSTGAFGAATTRDFADDALGAVQFLKARKDVDPKRIGVIGHSEGGLIAPLAAVTSTDVAFIVMLAGPGVPGDEILFVQSAAIAKASGASLEDVKRMQAINEQLYEVVKQEPLGPPLAGKLLAVLEEAKKKAANDDERALLDQLSIASAQFATPWFKAFLTHDPRPVLRRVKCPVLVLNGELDLQVVPDQNLPEIAKALREGGNTNVTVRQLPGLNHLFQPCTSGSPNEYATIETTMSGDVLMQIADFVLMPSAAAPPR